MPFEELPTAPSSGSEGIGDRAKLIAKAVNEITTLKREAPGRALDAAKEAGLKELQRQAVEMLQDSAEAAAQVAIGLQEFIPVLLSKLGFMDAINITKTAGLGFISDVQEWLSADDLMPDQTMEHIITEIRKIVQEKNDPELNAAWVKIELTFQEAQAKSEKGLKLLNAYQEQSLGQGLSAVEKKKLLNAAWGGAVDQLKEDWSEAVRQAHKIEDAL